MFSCAAQIHAMRTAYRILVVDDNHLIRRLLDLILEGAGYVPVEAESGEEALALASEAEPDLCIVDEAMPGMQGSDVIRALRRSRDPRLAAMPVIGISGRNGAARELLAAGATTFVPKPLDEPAILAAIAQTLSQAGRPSRAGMPAA
jgi:two-component system, OmpR family, phosphate regulon response regulator PhoB